MIHQILNIDSRLSSDYLSVEQANTYAFQLRNNLTCFNSRFQCFILFLKDILKMSYVSIIHPRPFILSAKISKSLTSPPQVRRVGKGRGLRGIKPPPIKSQEIFRLMPNEIRLTLKRKIVTKFLKFLKFYYIKNMKQR